MNLLVSNLKKGDVGVIQFRHPECFRAGELHNHIPMWERVLENNPLRENIMQWLQHGINVTDFMQPFKGVFKGIRCNSPSPPTRIFKNHFSCDRFADFITQTITDRIRSGAI